MKALVVKKSIARYVITKLLSGRFPSFATGPTSLIGIKDVPEPSLPDRSWVKVRNIMSGICGSDLAVVKCKSSLYLSGLTSFPFIPGHEVVGEVIELSQGIDNVTVGERVVIEPALGCVVRGFTEPCNSCLEGRYANCSRSTKGDISAGLQTGFCQSLPGGWGEIMLAHESQIHKIPDRFSLEAAVLLEPLSCAIHGVLRSKVTGRGPVLVVGCGAIGLMTIMALRKLEPNCEIVAMAKYPHQRSLALDLGSNIAVPTGMKGYKELSKLVKADLRPIEFGKPIVVGGFPLIFECVGTSSALEDAVRWVMENGTVMMQGMPSHSKIDLTPVWYKQVHLTGSYAYGVEEFDGRKVKTFELAKEIMADDDLRDKLANLVRHSFPLHRYREAIYSAGRSGIKGGVKTVFTVSL